MQVREVMTDKVRAVGVDASVRQAAREMANTEIGVLPVIRDRELVGMLTDRDICVRVVGEGLNADETAVRDVMSSDVFTVTDDQDIATAGKALRDKQVRRAPVMNDQGRLVGIITLGDLAVKSNDSSLSGDVLEGISEPASPKLRK